MSANNLGSLAGIPKILTAVIDEDGNLIRGADVVSSVNLDKSEYHVVFNQDISECVPTVTKSQYSTGGIDNSSNVSAYVDTAVGVDTLYVASFDGGNSAEIGLNIVVVCP